MVVLLAMWVVSLAGAFWWGYSYAVARESSVAALIEASALSKIRDDDLDAAIGLLETQIDTRVSSHWRSVWAEAILPEFWLFDRVSHRGFDFVASYREENPRSGGASELTSSLLACYRAPGLPEPASDQYRLSVLSCYDELR